MKTKAKIVRKVRQIPPSGSVSRLARKSSKVNIRELNISPIGGEWRDISGYGIYRIDDSIANILKCLDN